MRINTNLSALNTQGRLNAAQTGMSKSLEKLSSGLRIGRAADDAAGLSISEKMRGQIKGLNRAASNAQEAISLVQTAEGALGETHSILQRMRELAVQSASDTATDQDRSEIQKEVDQLAKEITRISNTTEFNTKNLLSGAFGSAGTVAQKFQIGANQNQSISVSISAMDAKSLGVSGDQIYVAAATGATGISNTNISNVGSGLTASAYDIDVTKTAASFSGVTPSDTGAATGTTGGTYTGARDKTFIVKATAIGVPATGDVTAAQYSTDGGLTWNNATAADVAGNTTFTLSDGVTLQLTDDAENSAGDTWTFTAIAAKGTLTLTADGGANIGASQTIYNDTTSVTIGDASTDSTMTLSNISLASLTDSQTSDVSLSIQTSTAASVSGNGKVTSDAVTYKGINVSTQSGASLAITAIDNAIKTVSAERSTLGAVQNRLEHTISNLNVTSENMTAAESNIRDVDMAKEMSNFTRDQILSQAATAMLAQANQVPQGVLKLLG